MIWKGGILNICIDSNKKNVAVIGHMIEFCSIYLLHFCYEIINVSTQEISNMCKTIPFNASIVWKKKKKMKHKYCFIYFYISAHT